MAKINVVIPEHLHERLKQAVPWGLRSKILAALIEVTVTCVEKEGLGVVDLILDRTYHPGIGVLKNAYRGRQEELE